MHSLGVLTEIFYWTQSYHSQINFLKLIQIIDGALSREEIGLKKGAKLLFFQVGKVSTEMHKSQGIALVAALLLVVVVGIVAPTVLETTSTELKISENQKRAVQDFYAAEAGLAEGQVRRR